VEWSIEMEEKWVIVNMQGEYLKRVISSLSEEYTIDINEALKFGSKLAAQKECDVFEGVRQIN
jgi:hypothetical protein